MEGLRLTIRKGKEEQVVEVAIFRIWTLTKISGKLQEWLPGVHQGQLESKQELVLVNQMLLSQQLLEPSLKSSQKQL